MKRISLSLMVGILALALPVWASPAPGFKNGNKLQIVPLAGTVNVQCQTPYGMQVQNYYCNTMIAEPDSADVFVAGHVDADHVILVATHQSGKKVSKTVNYNSKTGESEQINLLLNALFDHPLLGMGENSIQYILEKGVTIVSQGVFTAQVSQGAQMQCPWGNLFNSGCNNYGYACNEYFNEYSGYCR